MPYYIGDLKLDPDVENYPFRTWGGSRSPKKRQRTASLGLARDGGIGLRASGFRIEGLKFRV